MTPEKLLQGAAFPWSTMRYMHSLSTTRTTVIVDTNVVLDWLVFRNPECDALGSALVSGRLRWLATPAMREELAHVLGRGHLDPWQPDPEVIWATWARHCEEVAVPLSEGPPGRLRCSDPDDQKFIDLAVAAAAQCLLTRDRAVLKLARRLREHGVQVSTPTAWREPDARG